MSPNGKFFVSGSLDKSMRLCERTDEPLVLHEEREMEREKEAEEQLGLGHEHVIAGELTVRPGSLLENADEAKEGEDEMGIATRKTVDTVKAVS